MGIGERGQPDRPVLLAQRAREDGARWTRAVKGNQAVLSGWGVLKSGTRRRGEAVESAVLADRAQSECARSMRAIEADPPHRPAGVWW